MRNRQKATSAAILGFILLQAACACSKASTPAAGVAAPAPAPPGKSTLVVPLSAGAPFTVGPGDAGGGAAAAAGAKRAEECLADPTCPSADAARLFVEAADANDPNLDCFRFEDGMGTSRDLARARSCFEHQAKSDPCQGGSADLQVAELAMMRIDGVGGRADVAGGRALLADCFDDVTRSGVLEHAAAKERDPRTPPVDFCKTIGGTTITGNQCMARESKNADTRLALAAKSVVAGLDADGKRLFASSEKAYADYVAAMGTFAYQVYVEGTIRGAMALGEEQALTAVRAKDLTGFSRFVAKETSGNEVEAAQRASAAALAKVAAETTTPAERDALQKTQTTWRAYRDAEVALYVHVFGPKQGAERVRAAEVVLLESRRAQECAPPSAGPQ